jgi:hypothetical protein
MHENFLCLYFILMIYLLYSQSCIQRSLLTFGTKEKLPSKTGGDLRLVEPDSQFQSVMVRILLLPEGNYLEKMAVSL